MDPITGEGEQLVNVIGPTGEIGSLPHSEAQEAFQQGDYKPASPEEVKSHFREQKYGTLPEQLKSAAEGALSATTFGLGTGLEIEAGVPLKDIRSRAEENPMSRMAGEVTGLVAQEFIPGMQQIGAQRLMSGAGAAGAKALGLVGEGALSKVGSMAVKGAIENGMFQSGSEISKMFYGDPNQSAETAALDIGLSGLIGAGVGGAFGAVSPLWKATTGSKLGGFLDAVQKRANGEAAVLPETLEKAVMDSGLSQTMAPEIRTAISGDPELSRMYNMLRETGTTPGNVVRENLATFNKDATNQMLTAVGKTPQALEGLENLSENQIGSQIKNDIKKSVEEQIGPLAAEFEARKAQFAGSTLGVTEKEQIADKIANLIQVEGLHKFPDEAGAKLVTRFLEYVPKFQTIDDLAKAATKVNEAIKGDFSLSNVGGKLRNVFRDAEDDFVGNVMHEKAPHMIEKHKELREAYGAAKKVMNDLDDRLRLGNYSGPKSFIKALDDMDPESVLSRLNPEKKADIIPFLKEKFPQISEQLRQYHLDKALRGAARGAPEGHAIKTNVFSNYIDKLSPEMRDFVLPREAQTKIKAIRAVMDAIPKHQTSGTARNLDNMWSKVPGGAMALASLLMGHGAGGAVVGFLLGQGAKWVSRDAPDAMRLAMLKFLGHSGPVEPAAFKAMVDYAQATIKGETSLNRAAKGMFKAGKEVLPQSKMPTEKDNERLDKRLQKLQEDPTPLFETGKETSYYLPDHNQGMSAVAVRATNYLNGLRPNTDKPGILDAKRIPSQMEKAQYHRALGIAQQPLIVLNHVKNGTVIPQDIVALKSIYPGLYDKMSQKLFNELTEHVSKGEMVSYTTRIGLSMFLGQPLDASMEPASIRQNQIVQMGQQQDGPQSQQAPKQQKGSLAKLDKMPNQFKTIGQARVEQRTKT